MHISSTEQAPHQRESLCISLYYTIVHLHNINRDGGINRHRHDYQEISLRGVIFIPEREKLFFSSNFSKRIKQKKRLKFQVKIQDVTKNYGLLRQEGVTSICPTSLSHTEKSYLTLLFMAKMIVHPGIIWSEEHLKSKY